MIAFIIISVVWLALTVICIALAKEDGDYGAAGVTFIAFLVNVILTICLCMNAKENKVLYSDMAKNPQCYSTNDLKEARKAIVGHKAHQGTPFSFYNRYDFPEINVYVMDEVDHTLHIVK